ncbi:phage terminase small subunit P27 family [Clostridium perfringens]|uniref:phage terminase small subunit P27 family n=1 Tax=Clostridium perfringens TaxID=1502 RepID=UPI001E510D8C|nr:phage terminase small subunit P27 family [Clostridium perfringens]WVL78359.1 phage terminase small subunit P27 family [Clostridium perfringens]
MARARKPANLKKGKSESKEQLKKREELEKQLMGSDDNVHKIPEHLNNEEKVYYKWLIQEIEISGLITNLDIPLLEQTANTLWMIRVASDHIRNNGQLVPKIDKFGNIEEKENPSIKILQNCQTKYNNFCNQLGLSPAARASLAGKKAEAKEESENELLKILRGDD